MARLGITTLIVIMVIGLVHHAAASANEGNAANTRLCAAYDERGWIGLLISEDAYRVLCSGVTEIEVSSESLDIQWEGQSLGFEIIVSGDANHRTALSLSEYSTKFVYGATATGAGCDNSQPQSARGMEIDGARFSAFATVHCAPEEAGEYFIWVRSGTTRQRFAFTVPEDLPTKAQFDAAELARRPRVELLSTRVKDCGYNDCMVFQLRNNTNLRVTDVDIRIYPRDRWGNPFTRCGYYGGTSTWWRINGRGGGQTFTLQNDEACLRGLGPDSTGVLVKVMFSDGTVWWP